MCHVDNVLVPEACPGEAPQHTASNPLTPRATLYSFRNLSLLALLCWSQQNWPCLHGISLHLRKKREQNGWIEHARLILLHTKTVCDSWPCTWLARIKIKSGREALTTQPRGLIYNYSFFLIVHGCLLFWLGLFPYESALLFVFVFSLHGSSVFQLL